MADKTTYIDNDLASGGTGTEIDPYASWQIWLSNEASVSYSAGDHHYCYVKGLDSNATHLLINGFDSDLVGIHFIAWGTDEESNAQDKGAGLTSSSTSRTILAYDPFDCENLRIKNTNGGQAIQSSFPDRWPKEGYKFKSTLISNTTRKTPFCRPDAGYTQEYENCVLVNHALFITAGVIGDVPYGNMVARNCTLSANGYWGICKEYGNAEYLNCLSLSADSFFKSGSSYVGNSVEILNGVYKESDDSDNYTDDTGTVWAKTMTEATAFTNSASLDFTLTAAAIADADINSNGNGTDGDAPTYDAAGVARGATSCSVGAFDIAAASGAVIANQANKLQRRAMLAR